MKSRIREHRGARVAGGETEPYLPPVPLSMPEAGWSEWLHRLARTTNALIRQSASTAAAGGGDITSVIAGTGLNGGGTTGDVTLNLTVPVPVSSGGTGATTPGGALANLGGISGNQTITLSGDLTGSGATSINAQIAANAVGTTEIANSAVTYAKVQNVAAVRLLGNPTGSVAAPSEISLGTNLSFAGTVLNAAGGASGLSGMTAGQIPIAATATTVTSSGNLSGDVTTAGSLATTLATVNSNVGTFQGLTVNAKGLVTAAANQNYVTGGPYLPLAGGILTGGLAVAPGVDTTTIVRVAGTSHAVRMGASSAAGTIEGTDQTGGVSYQLLQLNGSSVQVTTGLQVGNPTGGDKGFGNINAQGVYANNVLLTSDASLKRDIAPLPPCLPLVAAIEPRSYKVELPPQVVRHIDGTEEAIAQEPRPAWGFIAQDVEAAGGPGVEIGADGLRSLSYNDLLAVLWKALQETTARLEAVEAKLAA